MKQIIVMRRDLKMGKGKLVAQGAHASLKTVLDHPDHPKIKEWLSGPFTKIAVWVDSEEELFDIQTKASDMGVLVSLITDAGRTQFNGVATNTCIAVGPDSHDVLSEITGHLKLI